MNKALKTIREKIQGQKDLIAIAKDEVEALEKAYDEVEDFYDELYLVRNIKPSSNFANSKARRYEDRATGDMYLFTLAEIESSNFQVSVYIYPANSLTSESFLSFPMFFVEESSDDVIFEAAIDMYMLIKFDIDKRRKK